MHARMTDQIELDTRGEILDLEKFPNYLVRDARSIRQLLTQLAEKHCLLSVHLPGGNSFVSTVLALTAREDGLILDRSPDEHINQRATVAERLTCVTRLDGIRIQFEVEGANTFPYDGFEALATPLPDAVLRLQRRECFRLSVPINQPVYCQITLTDNDGQKKTHKLRVLDISAGGVALVCPPDENVIAPGMSLDECVLLMPELDAAPVRLKVRNQFTTEGRNGIRMTRTGCEFVDLSGKVATNIQRYIFKVERDRRQLQAGG